MTIEVMLTCEGFPMGHEVFPGDTCAAEAFLIAFGEAKRQFDLKRVMLASDQGIVSGDALAYELPNWFGQESLRVVEQEREVA